MAKGRRRRLGPRSIEPEKALLVWRGVVLVAVAGAGLAGLGVSVYARQGDALTAGLFAASLLALLALLVVALARVRALLRPG